VDGNSSHLTPRARVRRTHAKVSLSEVCCGRSVGFPQGLYTDLSLNSGVGHHWGELVQVIQAEIALCCNGVVGGTSCFVNVTGCKCSRGKAEVFVVACGPIRLGLLLAT